MLSINSWVLFISSSFLSYSSIFALREDSISPIFASNSVSFALISSSIILAFSKMALAEFSF
jgi:hypothetical protein